MKGKLQSYLSCIPDLTCFDLKAESDDFLLISTDGIFSAMDIADVVLIISYYIDQLYKGKIR
jgi:serine/threonine protein phosphatase PrpC